MKKTAFLALIIVLALFVSCGKKNTDSSVYSNTDKPSDPTATLDLKKLFTISSENQTDTAAYLKRPVSLTIDNNNNIYILDLLSMSIKKFDSSGNFIKSIGRMGQGPGELFYPSIMYIVNDTINVVSAGSAKVSKFNLDGDFYNEKHIGQVQMQNTKISRDGSRMVSYLAKQVTTEGQMPDLDFSLSIIGMDSLKEQHALKTQRVSINDLMQGKIDINELVIPFVPGNEDIYVSENSDNQYRIFVYGYDGVKKHEIRKDFQMIRYDKAEKEKYIEEMKKMMRGTQEVKVGNFKKAIVSMHTDKYGRLLVIPNVDRNIDSTGVYMDIFKDGKFLNRIPYEIQDKENIGVLGMFKAQEFFIGDRLYVLSNEDLSIDVYEY